jgi:oligosaccharide amylase
MSSDFGVIGNGEMLAKVRADGAMTEAFYPSIGFFRHLVQSQFGLHYRETGECVWLAPPEFQVEQRYLEDTNVLQTSYLRPELWARVVDFVHPDLPGAIRTLEVQNTSDEPITLDLFHTEASSVADHKGEFGYNVAYYNRLDNHVVRYRGHPWDKAIEAQVVWLISGLPQPDTYQCGVSYQGEGDALDAFLDVRDGNLQENRYAFGDPTGATSALMWHRRLEPQATCSVTVMFVAGMTLFEAEDTLTALEARPPAQLLGEAVTYWRGWLETGKRSLPVLHDARLEELYLRSILLLKLLQDRKFGSLIAAPTLSPDYRYCWPRDAVYLAWALDRCGYHEEARKFYRWCKRTQMHDGLWYQNHYTDGRRHWAGIQVDQVASVIWGAWQHFDLTRDRSFLVEMWPTLQRAANYLIARTDPKVKLVYSEQDLWEETGGFLTYTNASAVAGFQAAANAAREVGQETEAARWRAAADNLKRAVYDKLVQNGYFVGEVNPTQRFHMRKDYLLDISNIGLAVPFRVVPPDCPEMVRTVQRLEEAVDYPIEGVGRYPSDLFVGGNPWSLSAIWLGLYFAETGQVNEVYRHLNWCLKHAMLHDLIPEQSDKHTGAPASAAPLAWSHAWLIILLQDLGRLIRDVPDGWTPHHESS